MAIYSFKHKTTNEEFDIEMKISEHSSYINDHPELEQILKSMRLVDPVGIGVTKPPSDFQNYVVQRMKDNVAGATAIGNKRWGRGERQW